MDIDNNHVTKLGELKSLIDQLWAKIKSTFSAIGHTHTKSDVTDFPTNVGAFTNDVGYLTEDTADKELFWCTYGTTTYDEVMTALNAGKFPLVEINLGEESEKPAIFVFCGVQTSRGGFFIQFRTTNSNGADSPSILHYYVTLTNIGWGDVGNDEFAKVKLVEGVRTCDIDITGNAATADNASGRKFTAQSEGEEAFLKASNGTQTVVLDVLGDGSRRGIYCNASGTASSGLWPILIDINNNVSLNGTATYASALKLNTNVGNSAQPVYFTANGQPTTCSFKIVIGSTGTNTSTLYFV